MPATQVPQRNRIAGRRISGAGTGNQQRVHHGDRSDGHDRDDQQLTRPAEGAQHQFGGRRIGGRKTAWISVFVLVSSPFAFIYATYTVQLGVPPKLTARAKSTYSSSTQLLITSKGRPTYTNTHSTNIKVKRGSSKRWPITVCACLRRRSVFHMVRGF